MISLFAMMLALAAPPDLVPVESRSDLVALDLPRGQEVTFHVFYPGRPGSYPAVLYSHDAEDSAWEAEPLVRFWVEHGLIVILPEHTPPAEALTGLGSTDPSLSLALIGATRLQRVEELRFMIDSLEAIQTTALPPGVILDRTRFGLAGHGLGAQIVQWLGGAIDPELATALPPAPQDSLPAAFLLLDPPPLPADRPTARLAWKGFRRPFLLVADDVLLPLGNGGPDPSSRLAFENAPRGDKFLLWFQSDFAGTLLAPPAPLVPAGPLPALSFAREAAVPLSLPPAFPTAAQVSLDFWRAYLLGDAHARDRLLQGQLPENSGLPVCLYSRP